MKKRICSVLSFRKHKKVWIVIGVLICLALCLLFLTNPYSDNTGPNNAVTDPDNTGNELEGPNNMPAKKATVVVKIDGVEIEPYSGFLFAEEDGTVGCGELLFVSPPSDEIPEFTLKKGMEITINGNKEETVKSVKDMSIQNSIYSFMVDDVLTLEKGKYLFNFDAIGVGTGEYEGDKIGYAYYFYVTIEK